MNALPRNVPHFQCFEVKIPYIPKQPLHAHKFHEIFFCTKTGGLQLTDHQSYALRAGDLYFFASGQGHHVASARQGESCSGVVLYFYEQIFKEDVDGDGDMCKVIRDLCEKSRAGSCQFRLSPAGDLA